MAYQAIFYILNNHPNIYNYYNFVCIFFNLLKVETDFDYLFIMSQKPFTDSRSKVSKIFYGFKI